MNELSKCSKKKYWTLILSKQIHNTHVLATVVTKPKAGSQGFLPLTVEYLQKASAAGRIPNTFARRDFGASNQEILIARMIGNRIAYYFSLIN